MSDVWIVNASPLIALGKIGQLTLLERLAPTILIPKAVSIEILAGPLSDPARQSLEAGWGQEVVISNIPREIVEWGLGPGETEVLAAAMEHGGMTVVLDDAQARACARTLGLSLIGTIGVVLRAKVRGLVPAASPLIKELQSAGLWIDASVIEEALLSVGETWST